MTPLLLVLFLAVILFGAGFALKALWWIAGIVLVVWLLGFVIRPAHTGGGKGRWYRWQEEQRSHPGGWGQFSLPLTPRPL